MDSSKTANEARVAALRAQVGARLAVLAATMREGKMPEPVDGVPWLLGGHDDDVHLRLPGPGPADVPWDRVHLWRSLDAEKCHVRLVAAKARDNPVLFSQQQVPQVREAWEAAHRLGRVVHVSTWASQQADAFGLPAAPYAGACEAMVAALAREYAAQPSAPGLEPAMPRSPVRLAPLGDGSPVLRARQVLEGRAGVPEGEEQRIRTAAGAMLDALAQVLPHETPSEYPVTPEARAMMLAAWHLGSLLGWGPPAGWREAWKREAWEG